MSVLQTEKRADTEVIRYSFTYITSEEKEESETPQSEQLSPENSGHIWNTVNTGGMVFGSIMLKIITSKIIKESPAKARGKGQKRGRLARGRSPGPNSCRVPGQQQEEPGSGLQPCSQRVPSKLLVPRRLRRGRAELGGRRQRGSGPAFPAAPVPTRTYLSTSVDRGRLPGLRRRLCDAGEAASGGGAEPGLLARGARRCCGGLRAPLWLCSESYRGRTTHLKPASPQDPGEGRRSGEETGVGARSRSGPGAAPRRGSSSGMLGPALSAETFPFPVALPLDLGFFARSWLDRQLTQDKESN
ncbi:uncharacterized protein LOC118172195 [Oxyura jamaicensis]|uniref:uncharacterized protein LOC118172195 n=1 Tax=Oxyura jamaicensis TaxID=8884 RepID=UPI0015A66EEA|nr:uncharacterized protein LOC118172195 [Oxyura jamaicensis]